MDVYYDNDIVGSITINRNSNTISVTKINDNNNGSITVTDNNGIDANKLLFTFNSKYREGSFMNNSWNRTAVPYTATMSLEQLLNGGALNFTRQ